MKHSLCAGPEYTKVHEMRSLPLTYTYLYIRGSSIIHNGRNRIIREGRAGMGTSVWKVSGGSNISVGPQNYKQKEKGQRHYVLCSVKH